MVLSAERLDKEIAGLEAQANELRRKLVYAEGAIDVTKQLRLTVIYPAEDYDATTDDIAYPQEWFAALEWELAKRLAPKFNKRWTKTHEINWEQATQIARQLNPQSTTVYYQPHADGHA